MNGFELHLWRHPRLRGADGLCIGALDWPVDPRRARRLARRIARHAAAAGIAREIATSPLARCRAVARHLRTLGWRMRVDERLRELDFGRWHARRWSEIPPSQIAAWEADFLHYRPGGGESLASLRARLLDYVAAATSGDAPPLAITHAGCIAALATLHLDRPDAAHWPAAPPPGAYARLIVPVRLHAHAPDAVAPTRASSTKPRTS
ncbi:MAG: histidine phosphatase family protein [Pseudomonadota bacterium]